MTFGKEDLDVYSGFNLSILNFEIKPFAEINTQLFNFLLNLLLIPADCCNSKMFWTPSSDQRRSCFQKSHQKDLGLIPALFITVCVRLYWP